HRRGLSDALGGQHRCDQLRNCKIRKCARQNGAQISRQKTLRLKASPHVPGSAGVRTFVGHIKSALWRFTGVYVIGRRREDYPALAATIDRRDLKEIFSNYFSKNGRFWGCFVGGD